MRQLLLLPFALLASCQGPSVRTIGPPPDVVLATPWAEGTRFTAGLAAGLPTLDRWRAAGIWWREALGQTVKFSLAKDPDKNLPNLELHIDQQSHGVSVVLRRNGNDRLLAATRYGADQEVADLPAAIDRLAWSARLALGENVEPPRPVTAITSRDAKVVIAVDDATRLIRLGSLQGGYAALRTARQRDGGAPFVLQPLASCELLFGRTERCEQICREAINYNLRCSPTTTHLLGRTLLLAQAGKHPEDVATYDQKLLTLALVGETERPHDDDVRYTRALAHNYRAEFDQALPILRDLATRSPEHAFIRYHLGWAMLATGDPRGAASQLGEAARRIPSQWVLLPRAIAMFEAGQHGPLRALFQDTLQEHDRGGDTILSHQVLRMSAAHALLQNDRERARRLLLEDLRWLAQHPLVLSNRLGEFAESGAVLVRLGGSDELPALLLAAQKQQAATPTADACAFLGGMWQIASSGKSTVRLQEELQRGGDNAWAARLAAFEHERRGEVGEMQTELARAAKLSSSPMTKALLARSLRAVGKQQEADLLHETLRRELTTVHLRQPCQHPLYGPELAFAFAAR